MNLKMLLDKQKELDTLILMNAGLKEYPLQKIKLALQVELGELANEWQGFKYWKKNKKIDRPRLLDEFADCLHFALSLENHLHQTAARIINDIDQVIKDNNIEVEESEKENYILNSFKYAYESVEDWSLNATILLSIIALGTCLDITLEEMEKAYLSKHKVNYLRQNQGY